MTDLNSQQAEALARVVQWYEPRDLDWNNVPTPFRLFGYAGTGKTFTAARIPEALGIDRVVFGTYTGKAASVLKRSLARAGVDYPVSTIHSAIYFPTSDEDAKKELEQLETDTIHQASMLARGDLSEIVAAGWATPTDLAAHIDQDRERIQELKAQSRRLKWEWNPDSDWAKADLIILDEVSMVNSSLAMDIERYNVPVLVLGDPAQLPPVEGGGHYTNAEPNILLTQVERQARKGSPVLDIATRIRESVDINLGLEVKDMRPRSLEEAMQADVVLVWSNRRRWAMTNTMRRKMGRPDGIPVAGDTIMCLTNNRDLAVFNGELFEVQEAQNDAVGYRLTVRTDTGQVRRLSVFADGFRGQDAQEAAKNSGAGMRGGRMLATFGQVITVHKAQGSEWDSVYLVNETASMISMATKRDGSARAIAQARRWAYTGATRAKRGLIISRP